MRWAALLGLLALFPGCAHLIPTRPVVSEDAYLGPASEPPPSAGEPVVEQPVLPFAVWGLHFDEELVFELQDHDTWRMVEVVRLDVPGEGEVWFTLDSHRCGRQWVGAAPEYLHYAAGFPAPTYKSDFTGERSEDERHIRYQGQWTLLTGEVLAFEAEARKPYQRFSLRNGNGMNHSQETALAILDLEYRNPLKVSVTLDGQPYPTHTLSRSLLVQAAGGVMEARRTIRAGADGGLNVDEGGAGDLTYRHEEAEGGFTLQMSRPTGEEIWRFVERDGAQHVTGVELTQQGRSVLRMRVDPPLPDLRVPVAEQTEHRVVVGVNGEPGYMKGVIVVAPGEVEGTTEVRVLPQAPYWAAERPARSIIRFPGRAAAVVDTVIEPSRAWSFGDASCPDGDRP